MSSILGHPIRQVAYLVRDVDAAARWHSASFGSGPFFVGRHIALDTCLHRGAPGMLDHSSAYGQWGAVMVELVQVHSPAPSVFHDLSPHLEPCFHHVALVVPDLDAALARFNGMGWETGVFATLAAGLRFAMVDSRADLGHFVELYEPTPALEGLYAMVRSTAQDWDGQDVVRELGV